MLSIKENLTQESKGWMLESCLVMAESGWRCQRCLCGEKGGSL